MGEQMSLNLRYWLRTQWHFRWWLAYHIEALAERLVERLRFSSANRRPALREGE